MDILFLTPYLPSETSGHAGAQLIFRNIISLAKIHEITLASFIDSDESSMITDLLNQGIDVHTIPYPRNQKYVTGKISSAIRNLVAMVEYLKGKELFFFAKYKRKNMENLISRLVAENSFDLVFEKDALFAIVDLAIKRQTGARALRSIIEDVMIDVMYEIPTKKNIKTCTITKNTVENKTPPKLTYYKKTA